MENPQTEAQKMARLRINSGNRHAARKLLSTWYPSTDVRTWPNAKLQIMLGSVIRDGLITVDGVLRALGIDEKPQSGEARNSGEEKQRAGEGSDAPSADSDSTPGDADTESSSDSSSDSDAEQDSGKESDSSNSNDDSGSDDSSESKSKQESDSDDGEESESDDSSEEEQQQEGDDNDNDDNDDDNEYSHPIMRTVLKYVRAGLNVALVGPAGCGKTTLVQQVASKLDKRFLTTGAVFSKFELIGYRDAQGSYHGTPLHDAYANGGVFCFDELDASAPEAVVCFNGITDRQPQYAFPCGMVPKHPGFVAVATMNTWGSGATAQYIGRFKQDDAAMDRFVRVFMDYDRELEKRIAGPDNLDIVNRVHALRDAVQSLGLQYVVSTRKITHAIAARNSKATKSEIDRDVMFAGLDAPTIRQLKLTMKQAAEAAQQSAE